MENENVPVETKKIKIEKHHHSEQENNKQYPEVIASKINETLEEDPANPATGAVLSLTIGKTARI